MISKENDLLDNFLWAAREGDLPLLEKIVNMNVLDINDSNMDGNTALHMCAANGHVSCMEYLFSHPEIKISVNLAGNSPLYWAVQNNELETVDCFLSYVENQEVFENKELENNTNKNSDYLSEESSLDKYAASNSKENNTNNIYEKEFVEDDNSSKDVETSFTKNNKQDKSDAKIIQDRLFYWISLTNEQGKSPIQVAIMQQYTHILNTILNYLRKYRSKNKKSNKNKAKNVDLSSFQEQQLDSSKSNVSADLNMYNLDDFDEMDDSEFDEDIMNYEK